MTKILAVSDKVVPHLYDSDVRQRLPRIDLILGCGDLPFYYLEFLQSALDAQVLYVHGNHDQKPQFTADGRVLRDVQGGIDVHGRIVTTHGLAIAGLEGSMRYRPGDRYMYSEGEMRRQVGRLLPRIVFRRLLRKRNLDILITHSPVKDIHDLKDLPHTGFKVFRTFLKIARPKYMLHGHVHHYDQVRQRTEFEQTEIINVYPSYLFDYDDPERISTD